METYKTYRLKLIPNFKPTGVSMEIMITEMLISIGIEMETLNWDYFFHGPRNSLQGRFRL